MQNADMDFEATAESAYDASRKDREVAKNEDSNSFTKNEKGVTVDAYDLPSGDGPRAPTLHERATLPRVPGPISLLIFTVAFIEFCERFSYYGCTNIFTNFIQQPLPPGSTTGAIAGLDATVPGALGRGQRTAFGITTFNSFWAYVTPLFGAYVADTYLGRYKTVTIAVFIAIFGHIFLIVAAAPAVIPNSSAALGILATGVVIFGIGTGAFKSNISPLIAEQMNQNDVSVKTLKNGDKVLIDPALTTARIMNWFYLLVNLGSVSGQLGMVYAERNHGFWLAFTLPTLVLCICPFVLWWGKNRYHKTKPNGSIAAKALRTIRFCTAAAWSWNPRTTIRNIKKPDFWSIAKPSYYEKNPEAMPGWVAQHDDLWVEEVRRGLKACGIFALYPFYWVCYNQINNNLTSQAATMQLNGVPNDLINNLNPISLIIMIPIMDIIVYPFLYRKNINFTPIKRITLGFFFASISMVVAAIIQHFIYQKSPCGEFAATCDEPAPLNVWIQTPVYVLIGISEIFASITGLSYAFNKAPKSMRSLVTAIFLLANAGGSALGQALIALTEDPRLVINYGVFAGLSFAAGVIFWIIFRKLDAEEHVLNDMRRVEDWKEHAGEATFTAERILPAKGGAPAPADVDGPKSL